MEPEALCFRVVRPSVRACSCEGLLRPAYRRHLVSQSIGNESVPIQLAQCRFPGLAISNAKMFQIKYTEAILSSSARKLLWFEIGKMLTSLKRQFRLVWYLS